MNVFAKTLSPIIALGLLHSLVFADQDLVSGDIIVLSDETQINGYTYITELNARELHDHQRQTVPTFDHLPLAMRAAALSASNNCHFVDSKAISVGIQRIPALNEWVYTVDFTVKTEMGEGTLLFYVLADYTVVPPKLRK